MITLKAAYSQVLKIKPWTFGKPFVYLPQFVKAALERCESPEKLGSLDHGK